MKQRTILFLLCAMLLFTPVFLRADDEYDGEFMALLFEKPVTNHTLKGYFTEIMTSVHTGMVNGGPCVVFGDMYLQMRDTTGGLGVQGNIIAGGMIPLGKHFAIPLFGEIATVSQSDTWDEGPPRIFNMEGMAGGGFAVYGQYGVLAGYLGYGGGRHKRDEWGEYTHVYSGEWRGEKWEETKTMTGYHTVLDEEFSGLEWAVFPVLNAGKLPILNTLLQTIDGFYSLDKLRMDRDEFQSTYKANVLFRNIGGLSLGAYTRKDWYNADAKYDLHAGKLNLTMRREWSVTFGIEGGYRKYFDVTENNDLYEDGAYTKLTLDFFVGSGEGALFSFYCESGSKSFFTNPVFGVLMRMVYPSKSRWHIYTGMDSNLDYFDGGGSWRLHTRKRY